MLRDRRFHNFKFRRQHAFDHYILDFVCIDACLIIEVDGGQHCESASDSIRTKYLEAHGWRVLRFWNNDVLLQSDAVLEIILSHLDPLTPTLSP